MTGVVSFSSLDWTAPWFAPVQSFGEPVSSRADWRAGLNERAMQHTLHNHRGLPVQFIPPETTPASMAYEACISHTGHVPTRNNLHDFFNALIWLRFPAIKCALNATQAAEIARHGIRASRGSIRDAATLFDENGALFVVRQDSVGDAMTHALRNHDWQTLFVQNRNQFQRCCDVVLFGHALLEKLTQPYKAITAHAWCIQADTEYFQLLADQRWQWLDHHIAAQLQPGTDSVLHASRFCPLPVLGIPDWWPQQDTAFYNDAAVFRVKRRGQ